MENRFIFENIVNDILLTEGAESRNMKQAKHYLYDNFGYDESRAMQVIGNIKSAVPNVRLAKCKFIMGVTRMFMNGELNDGETLSKINQILRLVASDAHVNEYDYNLNNLKSAELIRRFSKTMQGNLDQTKSEIGGMELADNNDYQIVKIPDFETAEEYSDYVTWCVTQDPGMYSYYTHSGIGLFYFCLKNGFENVPEEKGENCPLDEYGLSMIAVSVNSDGSCNTITCRWNHDNNGNDNIMTEKELSQLIGRNFYEVFKPYTPEEVEKKKEERDQKFIEEVEFYFNNYGGAEGALQSPYIEGVYIKPEIDYDEYDDEDDADYYDDEDNKELVALIYSSEFSEIIEDSYESEKFVIINTNGELIGDGVYDEKPEFDENTNTLKVVKNGQTNEITLDGVTLYPLTVDKSYSYDNLIRLVYKDGWGYTLFKYTSNGRFEFAIDAWFKSITPVSNGNFITRDSDDKGKLLNINTKKIAAEGFVETKKVSSELLFIYYQNENVSYFKLFKLHYGDGTKQEYLLVSNVKFKEGQGFMRGLFYGCIGIDNKKYKIHLNKKQTYVCDEKWNELELVDTVNASNNPIKENFYQFYRRIL